MSDVAFLNSTAGFTGGALHLQNTQHITAGQPFVNVTISGSFSAGFAGAVNVFGGKTAQKAIPRGVNHALCHSLICGMCSSCDSPSF